MSVVVTVGEILVPVEGGENAGGAHHPILDGRAGPARGIGCGDENKEND